MPMCADVSRWIREGEVKASNYGYVHHDISITVCADFVTAYEILMRLAKEHKHTERHLPGKQGLVVDPNDDFNCEKPAMETKNQWLWEILLHSFSVLALCVVEMWIVDVCCIANCLIFERHNAVALCVQLYKSHWFIGSSERIK